jgi:hypothetical protein
MQQRPRFGAGPMSWFFSMRSGTRVANTQQVNLRHRPTIAGDQGDQRGENQRQTTQLSASMNQSL